MSGKQLLFVPVLAALLLAAYANSFEAGFYFDDTYGISENPSIRSLRNIPRMFVDPHAYWTDHTQPDMRPILMASYAVNYAISGVEPWSYHVINLILHFVAALLVLVLVRDHVWPHAANGATPFAAAASASLLFALAPLNSQPVVYLWARSALLCTVFYLAAFLAFVRRRALAGALLHALALLTKAIAVSLPAVLIAWSFFYRDRQRHPTLLSWLRDWRPIARLLAIPIVLDALYLVYRSTVLPPGAMDRFHEAWVTPKIWFMSQWPALLYYVRLFLWPTRLSVDHDFPYTTEFLTPRAIVSLLAILSWVGASFWIGRRHPQVGFATLWFFFTLGPESSFSPLAEVINDHRPYIATSLGLSVLLTWAIVTLAWRLLPGRASTALLVAVGILCAAAIPVTIRRNREWGDRLRLWEAAVRTSPNNPRAWMNAGQEHLSRGNYAAARRHFDRALQLSPGYAFLHMNYSALEGAEGKHTASIAAARKAVELRPDYARSHYYLGLALERASQPVAASAAYAKGLSLNPRDGEIRTALQRVQARAADPLVRLMDEGLHALYTRRDPTAAINAFVQILRASPAHYGATFQLARAYDEAGRFDEATPLWRKTEALAVRFKDRETELAARARLSRTSLSAEKAEMDAGLDALYRTGDPAGAARHFRSVLRSSPGHYGATYQLAVSLDRAGQRAEARLLWEKMLPMAERAADGETLATVRARLAERP